jgi:hypothetical protein
MAAAAPPAAAAPAAHAPAASAADDFNDGFDVAAPPVLHGVPFAGRACFSILSHLRAAHSSGGGLAFVVHALAVALHTAAASVPWSVGPVLGTWGLGFTGSGPRATYLWEPWQSLSSNFIP